MSAVYESGTYELDHDGTLKYKIALTTSTYHRVGYAVEKNEIFEYWLDGDLMFYFSPHVTDALLVCPFSNLDLNKMIDLGEL